MSATPPLSSRSLVQCTNTENGLGYQCPTPCRSIRTSLIRLCLTSFSARSQTLLNPSLESPSQSPIECATELCSNPDSLTQPPRLLRSMEASWLGSCSSAYQNYEGTSAYIVATICTEAEHLESNHFSETILQLLRAMLQTARQLNTSDLYRCREMYQRCLKQYILRFVQQEPVHINWSRRRVNCSCPDCARLNQFLASPVDQVWKVRADKSRRHHLHIQLDRFSDCTHLTDHRAVPTLVITKTGRSYSDEIQGWNEKGPRSRS